ncbi:hypothetical protein HDV00_006227 [Rhizophlyctis rosea]|nr:hypothetical protein HDV00_006227 [Rhizophlyctis rosea]
MPDSKILLQPADCSYICTFRKEEMKKLRHKLRKLEKEQHTTIASLLSTTSSLSDNLVTIPLSTLSLPATLPQTLSLEPSLIRQRAEIEALHTTIEGLEAANDALTNKEKEMVSFQHMGTQQLEEKVRALKDEAVREGERRRKEMEALRARHELSVEGVKRRTEGIVNGVETVASQQVIDAMSATHLHTWKLNKQLKHQLAELLAEEQHLSTIVQRLEEYNLGLVWNLVDVEWNFDYEDEGVWEEDFVGWQEEWEDGMLEGSDDEGGDASDSDEEEDDENDEEGQEPHIKHEEFLPLRPSTILRLPPLPTKPERATQDEWIHKAVTGQIRLPSPNTVSQSANTTPHASHSQLTFGRMLPSSTDPKEIEASVKRIFAAERARREEDAKVFGVRGKKVDVHIGISGSISGGVKYYDLIDVMA